MNLAHDRHGANEIARGIREALAPALEPNADVMALAAARDVAQMLGFTGLDRVLAVCESHLGRPHPAEVTQVLERVGRIAAEAERAGQLAPYVDSDRELAALADQIADVHWSASPDPASHSAVATLGIAEALAEYAPYDLPRSSPEARLSAAVAAALRASLDWLLAGSGGSALAVGLHDGVLELTLAPRAAEALAPAGEVLASVDGNLGPAPGEANGHWIVRVPIVTERATFLMFEVGRLHLALPWHAVLRLRMSGGTSTRLEAPVLDPIAPLAALGRERPTVLVAHGLRRAYLIADRLVWRLEALACEPEFEPPLPGLTRAVRTEDDETFWVIEPAWLLRGVTPAYDFSMPAAPAVLRAEHVTPIAELVTPNAELVTPDAELEAPVATAPVAAPEPLAPEVETHAPSAEVAPTPVEAVVESPNVSIEDLADAIRALRRQYEAENAPVEAPKFVAPPETAAAETIAPPETELPEAEAPARPRALIAEDSLVARVFLERLLRARGFDVEAVPNASQLERELGRGPWALVCVDAYLPDAPGAGLLHALATMRARGRGDFAIVALVRDAEDAELAARAGVRHRLHKPFEASALDRLLSRLGLPARSVEP